MRLKDMVKHKITGEEIHRRNDSKYNRYNAPSQDILRDLIYQNGGHYSY